MRSGRRVSAGDIRPGRRACVWRKRPMPSRSSFSITIPTTTTVFSIASRRKPASAPKTKDLQRPAPEARPNVSPWPSFTDLRRRAEAERAAYLRALLARIRAAWWNPLKVAFRKRPEIFGCVILIAVFAVLFGARSWGLVGPADCRTDPISLAFGPELNATMTTPAGRACLLSIDVA